MKRQSVFLLFALYALLACASYDFTVPFMECGWLGFTYDYSAGSDAVKLTENSIIFVGGDNMADNVILPDKVTYNGQDYRITSIGTGALTTAQTRNLTIGSFVESIDAGAIKGNQWIYNIILGNAVQNIEQEAFENCTSLKSISLTNNIQRISQAAFAGCTALTNLALPDNIKYIASRLCDGCTSLETVILPSELLSTDPYCFRGCSNLKNISLPSTLLELQESMFEGCVSLESINLPKNIVCMSNAVFKDCTSLYEITIPNSISSRFYFEMFRGCNNLVTITLGKNLERIQRNTFYDCNKLRRIICKNPNVTLPKDSQYGNSFVFDNFDRSKCILEVPNGKKQAYIDAGWTGFKEIVESPSTFDVNNDGQVDVSDVNEIINVILGKKDM